MNALLAAYIAFSYTPTASDMLPGIHHSPIAANHAALEQGCDTGWGGHYAIGETIKMNGLAMNCEYVATWVDGDYQGKSVRWVLSVN